jgi:hypothetical protein
MHQHSWENRTGVHRLARAPLHGGSAPSKLFLTPFPETVVTCITVQDHQRESGRHTLRTGHFEHLPSGDHNFPNRVVPSIRNIRCQTIRLRAALAYQHGTSPDQVLALRVYKRAMNSQMAHQSPPVFGGYSDGDARRESELGRVHSTICESFALGPGDGNRLPNSAPAR